MSNRLREYGSFIVDGRDAMSQDGTKALADTELAAAYRADEALEVVVHPAEVAGKPFPTPKNYTVFNPNILGRHGLKASLQVEAVGRAKLTIDTVPPIEAWGLLVRLDPERNNNVHPDQLTFVPQLDFDKATSALRNRWVDVR